MTIIILHEIEHNTILNKIYMESFERLYVNIDKISYMKNVEIFDREENSFCGTELLIGDKTIYVKETIKEINDKIRGWSIQVNPIEI